jgi:hypothetical protein
VVKEDTWTPLQRAETLDDLIRRATGYSPIHRAEMACGKAIDDLQDRGWVETVEGEYRLTPEGLAICDEDEGEIDAYLLSSWPEFSVDEVDELLAITARLNQHLEALSTEASERARGAHPWHQNRRPPE